jgi:transposase
MSRLAEEKDPEILRKAVVLLERHNQELTKQIREVLRELQKARAELAALKGESTDKQLRIEALEQRLAKLTRQVFGTSSEKRTTDEPPAAETPKPEDEGEGEEKKKKHPGHGPTEQPKLPKIDVDHDLDEADKTCPCCGGCLEEMGEYEEHDEIDVVPLRFVIKHHRRKKYACRCGGAIETAPGPDKLIAGGRYAVGFAIHVAISKYCDHLPLERQVRMMARDGLVVTSQTLWDQIEQLTSIIESVRPRLHAHVLSHPVVGADETTWELMGKKPGQGKSWYVWVLRVQTAVYYSIKDGRSATVAKPLFAFFAGVLMCDGYAAYLTLSTMYKRVVLAHCWVHVRREFVEIEKSFPTACGEIIGLIRELYVIEKKCAKGPDGDEDRRKLRNEESREVVDRIVEWFYRTLPTCLPESGLHKAMGYIEAGRPTRWL